MREKLFGRTLIGVFIILLITLGIMLWVISLSRAYPVQDGSKDWLDIVSAIGQAAGAFVLIGLVVELSRFRMDALRGKTPDIWINAEIVDMNTVPTTGGACLIETTQPFLNLHPSNGTYDTDYVEAWNLLDPQRCTHFIRISIENRSTQREAHASNFKVQLEFTVGYDHREMTYLPSKTFWCPIEGIDIPVGSNDRYIYIKCAPSSIDRINYVTGKVLDYKCINLNGDSIIGKKQKFTPITITGRLVS